MNSRLSYLYNGRPICCAFCGQPFPVEDGHVVARESREQLFCSEFCADSIEEEFKTPRSNVLK